MAVVDNPRGEGGRTSQSILRSAAAALALREPGVPEDFLEEFFGQALPEDLERYQPEELAAIADDSWAFFAATHAGDSEAAARPGGYGARYLGTRYRQRRHAVSCGFGGRRAQRAWSRHSLLVHPVFTVERDAAGGLIKFGGTRRGDGQRESFIHIHVDGLDDEAARADVVHALEGVLADVRVSVQDWRPMLARASDIIADLRSNPPPLPAAEIAEAIQFLEWLAADNFILLGARDYDFKSDGASLEPNFETGLGLLRSRDMRPLQRWNQPLAITPQIRALWEQPRILLVTKSTIRSRVHRRADLDYIGVKRFGGDGKLLGECRFCGLFTSTAYTGSVRAIPYLRRKADDIIRRAGFDANSHSGKALVNVLENYPRDELFQIDEDLLYDFALTILQLSDRPRVRVLPRRDRFERFVSILVYVPRDRYDSRIRATIGEYLATTFKGRVSAFIRSFPKARWFAFISSSGATRARRRTRTAQRSTVRWKRSCAAGWTGSMRQSPRAHEPSQARELAARYRDAFPIDYREVYSPAMAVGDIRVLETLTPAHSLGVDLYRQGGAEAPRAGLKVFSLGRPISLSERVPVLENMGFRVVDERTYHIEPQGAPDVWFHDMELESASGQPIDLSALEQPLEDCFLAVMGHDAENDGYNALVLVGGLVWRDVALIRSISRFLRQIRLPYSQDYMWATLRKHTGIAASIVALFHARFDPKIAVTANERAARQAGISSSIETALQAVDSLDEDRILRHFVNAVMAAIRTNFYQRDKSGRAKDLIAIKFASRKVDDMPLPRPLYEVFLYSPRVEAVHLRFGKVARGGIRWSDRPQDFRTEVLGLVKAQNVKNAVIVPVGAKGGFIPKYLPAGGTREAIQAEGVATYKMFISTLLDITDNIGPGKARCHSARRRSPPRGRRSLSRGRRRQGHGDLLRHRQRSRHRARLLARRRVRLGRLGRIRPQEDRHHRARRLGVGQAPFPRDGHQYPYDAVHRGRRRRHVGRRVRQRHAAREDHQARRRFRPSRHFHRSRPGCRTNLRRTPAPVRSAALELAGFRQRPDLARAAASIRAAPRKFGCPRRRKSCSASANASRRRSLSAPSSKRRSI